VREFGVAQQTEAEAEELPQQVKLVTDRDLVNGVRCALQ
jgi:hypothetical protein